MKDAFAFFHKDGTLVAVVGTSDEPEAAAKRAAESVGFPPESVTLIMPEGKFSKLAVFEDLGKRFDGPPAKRENPEDSHPARTASEAHAGARGFFKKSDPPTPSREKPQAGPPTSGVDYTKLLGG